MPLVRAGVADTEPWSFDDPSSFYADSPEREWQWLRRIWAGRGRVSPDSWRLYFAVIVDGEPVGMQDLTGKNFTRFGTVTSFSWLAPGSRRQGLGKEMRAAILHLAFAGLGAREAGSDAFVDNGTGPNRVSRGLGNEPNGTDWDTRPRRSPRGSSSGGSLGTRGNGYRREDIELTGVEECLPVLGIG